MLTTTRRLTSRITIAALPAALFMVMSAGPAQAATPVTCGATLSANAALTKNLTCANGNGITLRKGVTLNLGGFTLAGPGAGGSAVTLSPKGGSTVTNGTIRGWALGIETDGTDYYPTAAAGKLTKVKFDKAPVDVYYASVSTSGSTFTHSPVNVAEGTFVATTSTFTKSTVDGFNGQISISGSTIVGGAVSDTSAFGVTIDRSTMDGTGYSGAPSTCSETSITIKNSTVKNYSQPISGFWCSVTLAGNTFVNNKGGVLSDVTEGFAPSEIQTFVTDNVFKTSGIVLNNGAMKVVGNTFTRNVTGIIAQNPRYTTITGNTFTGNSSSGVRAGSAGVSVGGNTFTDNGRYGINAPGAIDLGGNVASGNGLGDCLGVPCTT